MVAERWQLLLGFVVAIASGCGNEASPSNVPSDAGQSDASTWTPPVVVYPDDAGTPFRLSQTGLYEEIASRRIAPDLIEFEPSYKLWSDAADKRRWLRLPAGARIDTSDMDHWQFPIGAMLFKEFSKDGKLLETRLVARTGPGATDYWMGAFVWLEDESDAVFTPDGAQDVRGTDHDVPKVKNCGTCHNGDAGRVLGFSAVQLKQPRTDVFSSPPPADLAVPGDDVTRQALGYLHANCAHCHNPEGSARPDTDMNLRLSVADRTPEATNTYRTTIGVDLQNFKGTTLTKRVVPGDPSSSGVLYRMLQRGPDSQMPPLATERVDDAGSTVVRSWIESL